MRLRFGLRRLCAWMMVVLCCGLTLSAIVARAADDDLVKQLKELSEKLSPTPNNDAPLDPKVQEAWPAPGSEDTELGVLMEPEAGHGTETAVHAGVQA